MKHLLFKLTLLSGHLFLTLAPTPVFYFVSNFMKNVIRASRSGNCLTQKTRGGVSYLYGVVYWIKDTDPCIIIVKVIKCL